MKKRIISLILCAVMLLSVFPTDGGVAVKAEAANSNTHVNYGAAIGNTAVFGEYYPIPVSDQPENVNSPWGTDCQQLAEEEVPADLLMVVTDYYLSSGGNLWYQVKAVPGGELPEKLQQNPWVFQDNVQSPMGNSLVIHDGGRNFVTDAEGNAVTSVEMGLYDKVTLNCKSTLIGDPHYCWQILVGEEWVDIKGSNSSSVNVAYTLLANAMDADHRAQLRCVSQSGTKKVTGDPITVTVDMSFDPDSYVHPETPETPEITPKMARYTASAPKSGASAQADDAVCYVTVQYLHENGTQAANAFIAQVPVNVEQPINVIFPPVQGYLPYYNDVRQDSLSLNEVFTEDTIYTVIYKPTNVNYTVDIYFQNIENDDYYFYDSRTYEGLTGSKVPLSTKEFDGMRELLHETPLIAADGTTHVEVYYDRVYYMTRVYLMGGYGIYSVYARYGADLQSHLSAPTRPGYAFLGWDEYKVDSDDDGVPDTGGDDVVDAVYPTVPAKNLAYVALWKENPTAQVNIVFWGQDPNDDNKYNYLQTKRVDVKPGTELNYALSNSYICGWEEHEHDGDTCVPTCGLTGHKHTLACYKELHTEHTQHTESCYTNCQHTTHDLGCYTTRTQDIDAESAMGNNQKSAVDILRTNEGANAEGKVYHYRRNQNTYYNFFCLNGNWYHLGNGNQYQNIELESTLTNPNINGTYNSANAVLKCSHTHDDDCTGCGGLHTHTAPPSACYELICEEHVHNVSCYECVEHTHSATCVYPRFDEYSSALWVLSTKPGKQETVTVQHNGSSVLNVYFDRTEFTLSFYNEESGALVATIKDKWGASISDEFEKAPFNTTYNGYAWKCTETSKYNYALQTLDVMPKFDADFEHYKGGSSSLNTIYYYVQKPGTTVSSETWPTSTDNFELLKKVDTYFNYATYNEEYHEMVGYKRYSADIAGFTSGVNKGKYFVNNAMNLYYLLDDCTLEFHYGNDDDEVRTETVLYKESLEEFSSYIPPAPDDFETGSHYFEGWYLNDDYTGGKVDLSKTTMPAGALVLYARWLPKYHTVRLVKEKKDDGVYGKEDSLLEVDGEKVESIQVLHGNLVFGDLDNKIPPVPENGEYHFQGWFYMDDDVELMWDFEHHPVVTEELVIYAKWSSEVLVPYTVRYEDSSGKELAPPTTSSSLAGHSVTVKAKVGNELKEEGYFPRVTSHSIPLSIEDAQDGVEYTFVYDKADTVKYWIHYVDKDNGNAELAGSPEEKTSDYAVVTEKFKQFEGYVPDAYQKTLILSSDETQNHLYFYYTKSAVDGVWFVGHYVQNIDSDNKDDPSQYRTHVADDGVDKLGTVITTKRPADLSVDGFSFYKAIISDGTTTKTVTDISEAKGAVTTKGLEIKLYYTRNRYPYKVIYRDRETGLELSSQKFVADSELQPFGKVVSPPLPLRDIEGYEFSSASTTTIVKDDPANITKNIIYVYYTEQTVRLDFVVVGDPGSGTVDPKSAYVKVNTDPSTMAIATAGENYIFKGWYYDNACTNKVTDEAILPLMRPAGGWQPAIYYAKFEPGTADLTIKRTNAEPAQVYVYAVTNTETGEVIYVTVTGNGQTTIHDLPMGGYTVTQQNDWSWRHDDATKTVAHDDAAGKTVTFDKAFTNDYWLNGNSAVVENRKG